MEISNEVIWKGRKLERSEICDIILKEEALATCEVDKEKENNSDMDNNSVMVRTESNKDCFESIVSQETSPAVQKCVRSSKTATLDFPEAEGDVYLSSDYRVIKQQVLAEKRLSGEEHRIVKEHNNGGNKGTLACQQKVISSSSRKTGLTGSINRSYRSMKDVTVGCHQEENHDIIHIKVPQLSNYLIPNQIIWFQLMHL